MEKSMSYIQRYFKALFMGNILEKDKDIHQLAVETVSNVLGKTQEEVKEEELALLDHLFFNSTMNYDGFKMNNITDVKFRTRVANMYKHLQKGCRLEEAMDKSWFDPTMEEEWERPMSPNTKEYGSDSMENRADNRDPRFLSFKSKYPFMFDENDKLKPEACDLIDALIEKHYPLLARKKPIEVPGNVK